MFLEKETNQIERSSNIGQECTESMFIGNDLLCSLTNKGGIISNLIDLKKGIVLTSCPSNDLAIDKATHEPRYGLMYDVISKRYSGQYNLFNERYTYNWLDKEDSKSIILSKKIANQLYSQSMLQKMSCYQNISNLKRNHQVSMYITI
ncbi:MAG: hypothetical protein ACTSQC_08195 [Candidatus Heimdallarchaeaceae archaeon]